jgi:hypothetical protein
MWLGKRFFVDGRAVATSGQSRSSGGVRGCASGVASGPRCSRGSCRPSCRSRSRGSCKKFSDGFTSPRTRHQSSRWPRDDKTIVGAAEVRQHPRIQTSPRIGGRELARVARTSAAPRRRPVHLTPPSRARRCAPGQPQQVPRPHRERSRDG